MSKLPLWSQKYCMHATLTCTWCLNVTSEDVKKKKVDSSLTAVTAAPASVSLEGGMRNSKGWDDRHVWWERGSDLAHQSLPLANRHSLRHIPVSVLSWTLLWHTNTPTWTHTCVCGTSELGVMQRCGDAGSTLSDPLVPWSLSPVPHSHTHPVSLCSTPLSSPVVPLLIYLFFLSLSLPLKSSLSTFVSTLSPLSVSGLQFC